MAALLGKIAPVFFPLNNFFRLVTGSPPKDKPAIDAFANKPVADSLLDHIGVQCATWPKLAVAWIVYTYYFPAIATCATWDWSWVIPIIVRDLIITYATAGTWDLLMYVVFRNQMQGYKFNPVYPKLSQIVHDVFWSTMSTIISSLGEAAVLWAWANGRATVYTAPAGVAWYQDTATVLWLLSMPYWRLAHFYVLHRGMHRWNTKSIPDVGAFIYRWVHSLHHKSKNPTSWSGISMHPVESSGYYTAMLVPVLFGAHPLVMLYTKMDLTMAALIGHDGFGAPPGGGSQPHYLHHALVDCNYGENYAPFDWLFGTFVANEAEFQALLAARESKSKSKAVEVEAPKSGSSSKGGKKKTI